MLEKADLGNWGCVAIGNMEDLGGLLPRGAEKGAVADEAIVGGGAGVAQRGVGGADEYAVFEEANGERATETAAVVFCFFVSLPLCGLCMRAALPGRDVAVDVRPW